MTAVNQTSLFSFTEELFQRQNSYQDKDGNQCAVSI
jgi:hypothetical protein